MGHLIVLILPLMIFCASYSAAEVKYADPNATDSPGYGRASTGPKVGDRQGPPTGDAKVYDDTVKNSGLFRKDSPSYRGGETNTGSNSQSSSNANNEQSNATNVNSGNDANAGSGTGATTAAAPESNTFSSHGIIYDKETGVSVGVDPNYKAEPGVKTAPEPREVPGQNGSTGDAAVAGGQSTPAAGDGVAAGGAGGDAGGAAGAAGETAGGSAPISAADAKTAEGKMVRNDGPHGQIVNAVTAINTLVGTSTADAKLVVPGLPALMKAKVEYTTSRESCLSSQAQAEFVCQEETSPQLQSTLQNVNMIAGALNTIAVKDACGTMAKAMRVAQLGITGYTVACGALKFRCDAACGASKKALAEIEASVVKPAGCTSTSTTGQATCVTLMTKYKGLVGSLHQGVSAEMQVATPGTIGKNVKACSQEYGRLLLSAGIGILSTVNSFSQANNCSKNSDGSSPGSQAAAPVAATAAIKATSGTSPITRPAIADGNSTASTSSLELSSTSPNISPVMTGGPAAVDPSLNKKATAAPVVQKTREELEKEDPYRAYLPGGSKAASQAEDPKVSGMAQWRQEVTGANGPTNFNKMQDSYRSQKSTLLEY